MDRAVNSVLSQQFAATDHEVIVVNDSGNLLSDAPWQQDPRVRLLQTHHRERSVARNAGAAIARGRYLHFLDDDDWLLPGMLTYFEELARSQSAVWLYGGFQFVNGQSQVLEETHPDESGNCLVRLLAGEWVPLQASLIDQKAFFAVGGFDPSLTMYEDNDLARQVMLHGDIQATSHLVVAIVRDRATSTSNYDQLRKSNHRSRERLLNQAHVFQRLRTSAQDRPIKPGYWHGRIFSAYISSAAWNLQRHRFFIACSRLFYAQIDVLLAGRLAFGFDFWRGATRLHVTHGFFTQDGIL